MDSNVLIRVFDTELNYLGQVDDYESLIFRRKWSGYGEFEITLGYCSPILQARRFILLDEDPKRSGCIEYVQYDEAKGTYTVKGFSLLKLLETRITVPPKGKANQSYQGTPAEILQQLVTANAIAPEDSQRVIPHLVLGDRPSSGGSIPYEPCYNILAEDIRSIANACSLGAEIELNWREQRLEFVVRQGVDHTAAQSLQPRVIFSDAYDNISGQVYTLDVSSERNIGYVAGRGDGEDWKVVTVDLAGASGFERKEVFIDAHDVEEGANENALLRERGIAGLSAMRAADSYDFTVVSGTAMQYLQDWDLGDLVTVISDPLNTVVDERILEVEEVYDASGAQITPTVGEPEKTLQEKISGGSNGGGSYYDKANHSHPYLATSLNGAKNGVASLDENGLVPASQLPSYVSMVRYGLRGDQRITGTGRDLLDGLSRRPGQDRIRSQPESTCNWCEGQQRNCVPHRSGQHHKSQCWSGKCAERGDEQPDSDLYGGQREREPGIRREAVRCHGKDFPCNYQPDQSSGGRHAPYHGGGENRVEQ